MCGIFGVLSVNGALWPQDARRSVILHAIASLDHRGPDAWGIYSNPIIGFGHTRLAIVDVKSGHQPMDAEASVVVFNGEIFNHIELRQELEAQGVRFKTQSDTEVIVKLYEQIGTDCFARFNGQFSILLWDKIREKLIVGRDRYGIRPLYVATVNGAYVFTSELKALDVIPGYRRTFDPQTLYEHAVLWNTLADSTVYRDVRSVETGTFEIYSSKGLESCQRYYQVGVEQSAAGGDYDNFEVTKQRFVDLLSDSVRLRLRSDVPVGAYLSGGIDSTVIAHLIKQRSAHPLSTFSVGFDDKSLDESEYQKLAAAHIGTQHQYISVSHDDICANIIQTVRHAERPLFRTAPVPLYMLSQKVKDSGIKVVLTGEGADEILFGYDTFKELRILESWKRDGDSPEVLNNIQNLYPHLAHYADSRRLGLMKMYYEGFLGTFDNEFTGLNIRIANNEIVGRYLNPDLQVNTDRGPILEKLKSTLPCEFKHWSLLQRNSFLEIKTLMQGYLLSSQGDRMALGHGVEGRFPFLDHRVVDFAFHMPDDYKLKGFDQKHVLKRAFCQNIPEAIINRPKRPYMAPDLSSFISPNGQRKAIVENLLATAKIRDFGLFEATQVERFLHKFKRGVPESTGYRDNMLFIFLLTTQLCEHWIRNPVTALPDLSKCTVDISESLK